MGKEMKKTAKDQVGHFLENYQKSQSKFGFTTQEISDEMGLSRSVTSLYLNQLLQEKRVEKQTGKPVLWRALSEPALPLEDDVSVQEDIFEHFIGASGSQKEVVEKCKSAVLYPPKGLNILITGNSGVGKSYFASLIHEFAKQQQVIASDAPYYVLNCADYANNPELLSSALFGHVAGAFTGANHRKIGLLKEADGGYLFLDEVHRLSSENQEKLFTFMDTGKFRSLGENVEDTRSDVHFIFATTEDPKKVLLETFNRRVPVTVHLSNFEERPFYERLQLVEFLFLEEAHRIQRNLQIEPEVLNILCFHVFPGNIGKLRNNIQVSCAKAFKRTSKSDTLKIGLHELEIGRITRHIPSDKSLSKPIFLDFKKEYQVENANASFVVQTELHRLWQQIVDEYIKYKKIDFSRYVARLQDIDYRYFVRNNEALYGKKNQKILEEIQVEEIKKIIGERFGLPNSQQISVILGHFLRLNDLEDRLLLNVRQILFKEKSRSYHIATYFEKSLSGKMTKNLDSYICILAILLTEVVDESIELHGLILAHGKATASSIQEVVNQLCGNYVFDAIDMPIETTVQEISEEAIKLIKETDTSKGFILLVDMGSLNQLYTTINKYLDGDLLVINNLTTAIGLDIGLKMMSRAGFKEISQSATDYEISARYYEGFAQSQNILISCMSGLGISEKIQEIMNRYLGQEITSLTLDYGTLKELIAENDEHYFKETQFIITTTNLPKEFTIPLLNIYDIWDKEGAKRFYQLIKRWISQEAYEKMMQELLHFFSLEGVGERLQFLNPTVVLEQVETILAKYENHYHLDLDGKVKLNLYMHIALLVERLILDRDEADAIGDFGGSAEEQEFLMVSRKFFHQIESMYQVKVNQYEMSLLYELFKAVS